jgi:hypothetical protein
MNFSPAPINVRACGKDKQMNVAFLGPEVCARRALERNRPDCRIAGDLPPKFRTVDYLRDWLPYGGSDAEDWRKRFGELRSEDVRRLRQQGGHMTAPMQRIEVITRSERRRRWSIEEKREIVAESLGSGVRPSEVIQRHGITSGQLYAWR